MGTYSQPLIIQNSLGLANMNAAGAAFNASMTEEYKKMTTAMQARTKQNQASVNKFNLNRDKKINALQKDISGENFEGFGDDQLLEQLDGMMDAYVGLTNIQNPTREQKKQMSFIETLPNLISESAQLGINDENRYNEIMTNIAGRPGSLDESRSNPTAVAFAVDKTGPKDNINLSIDLDNLEVNWILDDQDDAKAERKQFDEEHEFETEGKPGAQTLRKRTQEELDKLYEKSDHEGKYEVKKLNVAQYVKSRVDKNAPEVFYTHGDLKAISTGTDKKTPNGTPIHTAQRDFIKKVNTSLAKMRSDGQDVAIDPADREANANAYNKEYAVRINEGSNEGILDSEATASSLWDGAVTSNIKSLEELRLGLQSGDVLFDDLNVLEEQLFETWYGDNWQDNVTNVSEDDNDPIHVYKQDNLGVANFGEYRGAKDEDDNAIWQRRVLDLAIKNEQVQDNLLKKAPSYIAKKGKVSTKKATVGEKLVKNVKSWAKKWYKSDGTRGANYDAKAVVKSANYNLPAKNKQTTKFWTLSDLKTQYAGNAPVLKFFTDQGFADDDVIRVYTPKGKATTNMDAAFVQVDGNQLWDINKSDFKK